MEGNMKIEIKTYGKIDTNELLDDLKNVAKN